jgi:radical SAM-linked protein
MSDQRLLFRKEGRAIYISHLDLMRTFQRAFKRAGIQIRHAGAFNPHPFISVAIPLSLGYSSVCELMDFGLESGCTLEEVAEKLNPVLPEGLTVIKAYDATRPTKEIGKLVWELELIYDNGIPDGAEEGLNELFSRPELVMQKKSKKAKSGFTTVDLIPLIGRHSMKRRDNVLCLTIDLAGQNPGLNPNLLQDAIGQEYPALKPDFLRACRLDILDGEGNRFEGDLRD